jgi:hypothetical protein
MLFALPADAGSGPDDPRAEDYSRGLEARKLSVCGRMHQAHRLWHCPGASCLAHVSVIEVEVLMTHLFLDNMGNPSLTAFSSASLALPSLYGCRNDNYKFR